MDGTDFLSDIESIQGMDVRRLLDIVTMSPDLLTDRYYRDFGVAIRRRAAELLSSMTVADALMDQRVIDGDMWFTIDDPRYPGEYNVIEDMETVVSGDGWGSADGLSITPQVLRLRATLIDPPCLREL